MGLPAPDANATVVVTGASSGIGAELARELSRRGHHVTIVARRRDRLEALAQELERADVRPVDLADPAGRQELLGALRAAGRFVAGLCNNAGFGTFGRVWELDAEREREEVALNVTAVHDLTLELLGPMVSRGTGAVLNVGSVAGAQPLPGNATYAASKAFVNSFSEALHAELKGTGVSCTLVTPGPVRTEFAEVADVSAMEGRMPGFAWKRPDEIARAAVEGMEAGRRLVAPGLATKLMSTSGRVTPRPLLLPLMRAAYRKPSS